MDPPKISILSATDASFTQAIPKRSGNTSFRTVSPHHKSSQNLVLLPSPTSYLKNLEKVSHPFLMYFYNPTPKAPANSREHHPPHKLPYLESTATLHQASLSKPKRQNHFPNNARLNNTKFLIPSPPLEIGVQTFAQFTKWYLNSSPIPPQRKSRYSFSMREATHTRIGNRDM